MVSLNVYMEIKDFIREKKEVPKINLIKEFRFNFYSIKKVLEILKKEKKIKFIKGFKKSRNGNRNYKVMIIKWVGE